MQQEGAGQTLPIPRLIPPETPAFKLAVSPAGGEEGAVPFQPHPYPPIRCAGWRRRQLVKRGPSPSNPTRDARVQSGCFTGGRRELFPSSRIPTHQSAASAGVGGTWSNPAHSPSDPTQDARVQSGCFTGRRRELSPSSPIPTHQAAASAGVGAGQTPPTPLLIPPETPGFNQAVSPARGGSCCLPAPSRLTNPLRWLE